MDRYSFSISLLARSLLASFVCVFLYYSLGIVTGGVHGGILGIALMIIMWILLFAALFLFMFSWYSLGKSYGLLYGKRITLTEISVAILGELHGIAGLVILFFYYNYKIGMEPMALMILFPWSGVLLGIALPLSLIGPGVWQVVFTIAGHTALLAIMPVIFCRGILLSANE